MKGLIYYLGFIKLNLREFDYATVYARDNNGRLHERDFHKGQDIDKKCLFMDAFLGDKNLVEKIEYKYR